MSNITYWYVFAAAVCITAIAVAGVSGNAWIAILGVFPTMIFVLWIYSRDTTRREQAVRRQSAGRFLGGYKLWQVTAGTLAAVVVLEIIHWLSG